MNLLESLQGKYPESAASMSEEQKAEVLRIQERLQAIEQKVEEYRGSLELHGKPLYWYLRASGFTNDEIWIYSPHIGAEVGAAEPEWV
jgi:hypothetical protein